MILVSVGTQLPFDRLIRAVDGWAVDHGRSDVIAQVGPTRYRPVALKSFAHVAYDVFRDLQQECRVMVCHAGMGSIITAMEFGKPIIVMPRNHKLGEHRNGHQFATLRQFGDRPGIYPADTEVELRALLERVDDLTAYPTLNTIASDAFVEQLAEIVHRPAKASKIRQLRHFLSSKRAGEPDRPGLR
ncbi:glycosyltransferase [Sphingomonas faeni]|uniref:glycosyltransferase n=1 Tax=Sphingomonas faeni TaxID=185950 RepID=UPI0033474736